VRRHRREPTRSPTCLTILVAAAWAVGPMAAPSHVRADDAAPAGAVRFQGEELYYSLQFVGAQMARGALVMGHLEEVDGQQVVPVYGLAVTEGLAALVYPLRDEGNTLVSAETGLAISTSKDLQERGEHRRYDVVFHQGRYTADNTRLRYGVTSTYERIVPSDTHDAFSWVYSIRDQDLTPGTSVVYFVWDGWKLSRVTATVMDDDDDILVGDEFIHCRRINLYREVMESSRPLPFIQETAALPPALWVGDTSAGEQVGNLWLSTDERRLPVQMDFSNNLISATARLARYRAPTHGY
jgi:hypothetical protein